MKPILVLAFCLMTGVAGQAAESITLAFPAKCKLGETCLVQNYVDHDPSGNTRDYQCGTRTYDGHDGTDIRLLDSQMQRDGVDVLAAAAGQVVGARDGMDDVSVRVIGKDKIAGKECGNGIAIEHANGWRTQYCHLAKGSVRVKSNDLITAGQIIGLVGLSGDTEFPHLHVTVRHGSEIVDPFAYGAAPGACGGGSSIWDNSLREQTTYHAREILNFGFSDVPPTMDLIETGDVRRHKPRPQSDAFTAYVRALGLQKGDQQILTLRNPDGTVLSEYAAPALENDKAQYFISSGKKRSGAGWPDGIYTATYRVIRNDAELLRKVFDLRLEP